jgi:hypothetical protein
MTPGPTPCQDIPNIQKFKIKGANGNVRENCAWVRRKKNKKEKRCQIPESRIICPITCDLC